VLRGDVHAMKGIGSGDTICLSYFSREKQGNIQSLATGRVIESNSTDNILVYFADHGTFIAVGH
jgi:hypothetical protein